jgi:hypothetical protein
MRSWRRRRGQDMSDNVKDVKKEFGFYSRYNGKLHNF